MKILLIILVGLFSFNSQAVVTISSVSGASNSVDVTPDDGDGDTTTTSTIEIYGGMSGHSSCQNETTTVNSCARLQNRSACNLKTVCPTTLLNITLKSDAQSGRIVLVDKDNNPIDQDDSSYTVNSTGTISIPWSEICAGVLSNGDASCGEAVGSTLGVQEILKVGVDNNGDSVPDDYASIKVGIYGIANADVSTFNDGVGISRSLANDLGYGVDDYYLYPGDAKAYLEVFKSITNYSAPNAAKITALRGFFAPGTCTLASADPFYVNNSSTSFRLAIDNGDIQEPQVDEGMENGIQYVFMFGFEDAAGNIGAFKDLTAQCDDETTGFGYNRHSVVPVPVSGLLDENQSCYITTAAYGSPLHSKVKTFKKFRDVVLKQFSLGRSLIEFYYRTSPPIAEKIKHNEFLRVGTRLLLWPAWAVSAVVLYMGLMPFLFVVTTILLSFVFLRERRSKKNSARGKLLVFFVLMSLGLSENSSAQDDFFSTDEQTTESAPNEPPYNGTENDEFSDLEQSSEESVQAEEEYEPEIPSPKRTKSYGGVKESPEKWKPYQRVPEEKRLKELSDKEGLFKITSKGGYQYKVKPSDQKSAASIRVGTATFPNLQNPSGVTTFSDIYGDDAKPVILADYEWQFFQGFGKLGFKIGSGLMLADGKGQFAQPINTDQGPTTDAKEKYNFYMFPNSISAVYRLDIFNRQWIVPFAEAGVDYLAFIEARDDGEDIKFGGAPHFHFAVGGSFLLDVLGQDIMAEVDKQYGVNHLWFTAEYRRLESMGADYDFTDDIINGGIMVEF